MRPPRLCACGHRVADGVRCPCERRHDAERDASRPNSSARGYNRAWEKARAAFLVAHRFCRRCGKPATVVDHIRPHRGDQVLFWDKSNWQPLCVRCHSSTKQREEKRARASKFALFSTDGLRLFVAVRGGWHEIPGVIAIRLANGGLDVSVDQEAALPLEPGASCNFRAVFLGGEERLFRARVAAIWRDGARFTLAVEETMEAA